MTTSETKHHLPSTLVQGYGVAALAISFTNTAYMFFLLKYMVDGAGMTPAVAGTVLLVAKGWDGVIDPLVGRVIDRTRTSWGSRRPWITVATPALAVMFASLWWGLPLTGWALPVVYAVLLMGYATAYSFVTVPYGALTPAITQDYDERTRLNGSRMAYSMFGGIVSGVLFPYLFTNYSWRIAGLTLGLMAVPPMLAMVYATRGRDPVGPAEEESQESILTVLKSVPFRRTAALFLAAWATVSVLSSLVPFYVEHHLHRKGMTDVAFAVIQVAALIGVPIVVYMAKKLQKHVAYAIGIGSWSIALIGLAVVPAGEFGIAMVIAAVAGLGVAAAHVLPWSMLPDVVEADALEHGGKDRAGAFYGAMTFLEQTGTAVALWVEGMLLSAAGYAEQAPTQPDSALLMLRLLIGPIPGVLLVIAAIGALLWPPLTREAHKALVESLAKKKQAAAT